MFYFTYTKNLNNHALTHINEHIKTHTNDIGDLFNQCWN